MRRIFSHIILAVASIFVPIVHAQTFADMVATMSPHSLPQVNLELDLNAVNRVSYVEGVITIAQLVDGEVKTDTYNCMLRYRGMFAANQKKKSFAVKLIDDEGEKLDASLLDMRSDNSWILDAMAIDPLRMRNRLCFDIWNEISNTPWDTKYSRRNGTEGQFVEVYLNGNYNGLYCFTDKINRKLLNLRKAKENDDGTVTVKGVLYKGTNYNVSYRLMDYADDRTDTLVWNSFELKCPDDYPCQQAWQPLIDIIDFNKTSSREEFGEHYTEWYYPDNLVDYWILINAFGITDMPYKNTFLSNPDINFDHRFLITPWDMDASLGIGYDGSYITKLAFIYRLNSYAPFKQILAHNTANFHLAIYNRWIELCETVFAPEIIAQRIDNYAQQFVASGAWAREVSKWNMNPVALKQDINEEIDYTINWYNNNYQHLVQQINYWVEDNRGDEITAAAVGYIYNYLLGFSPTADERLDLNQDGFITASDVTCAYNTFFGLGD